MEKEKKQFNQKEYINQYKKEHYSPLKINLRNEEKEELTQLLKKVGWSQTQFVRNAIDWLKQNIEQK